VIGGFLKPNFLTLSNKAAYILYYIVVSYEGKQSSPIPKIFKNIFNSILDEKIELIKEEKSIKYSDLTDTHKAQDKHYIKMGRRYEAFIKLISLLFERNRDKLFDAYPLIFNSMTSEFNNHG